MRQKMSWPKLTIAEYELCIADAQAQLQNYKEEIQRDFWLKIIMSCRRRINLIKENMNEKAD